MTTCKQALDAGYSLQELAAAGYVEGIREAGVTLAAQSPSQRRRARHHAWQAETAR